MDVQQVEQGLKDQINTNPPRSVNSPLPITVLNDRNLDTIIHTDEHHLIFDVLGKLELPLATNIRITGQLEARMSTPQTEANERSEGITPLSEALSSKRPSRSRVKSGASETQNSQPKVSIRSPQNILNISEASVSAPEQSKVLAAGEVSVPSRLQYSSSRDVGKAGEPVSEERQLQASDKDLHSQQESDTAEHSPPSPSTPFTAPQIRIHKPSDSESNMAAALGTNVITSTPIPPTTTSEALKPAVEDLTKSATNASREAPAASVPIPAVPEMPAVQLPQVATRAVGGPVNATNLDARKRKKRARVVKKVRKILLRPRVLGILLGKDVALTLGQHLSTAGQTAEAVPVVAPL